MWIIQSYHSNCTLQVNYYENHETNSGKGLLLKECCKPCCRLDSTHFPVNTLTISNKCHRSCHYEYSTGWFCRRRRSQIAPTTRTKEATYSTDQRGVSQNLYLCGCVTDRFRIQNDTRCIPKSPLKSHTLQTDHRSVVYYYDDACVHWITCYCFLSTSCAT